MDVITTLTAAPTRQQALVDDKGVMTLRVSEWVNIINLFPPIQGTGSPEGVILAQIGQTFIDTDADIVSSFLYMKQKADILGDRKKGWRLIV